MKIAKISISNIMGITELEFVPGGTFNEIAGRNGKGKSSILAAIKTVIEGGHDATLIRKGEEKGEVVLLMDDDTRIRKTITYKGVNVTVEKNGVKAEKPQSMIDALVNVLSTNPIDFLRAPPKMRVNVLLESIPMTADEERLAEIVGFKPKVAANAHALTAIDAVYTAVFDDRTGTNRAAKEKRNTISQLDAAIPTGEDGEVVTGDIDELLAQQASVDKKRDDEITRIDTKLAAFATSSEQKRDSIRTGYQTEIDVYKVQIEELNALINSKRESMAADLETERAAHAEIVGKANKQKDKARNTHVTDRAPIAAAISGIQQNQEAAARARVTRDTIATMTTEAEALESDALAQTASLEALQAYKSELLDQLPIDGLQVIDGKILRNGIIFDRLNAGQQVEIAVEIAKLRAGKLGVICVDGIELLDSEHFRALQEQMEGSGLQMFVGRTTDNELQINTN
jgi:DNA repair exonuclease SbcCD ATPase subunit